MSPEMLAGTGQSDAEKAIRRSGVILGSTAGLGSFAACVFFGGLSVMDTLLLSLIVSGTAAGIGSATGFFFDVLRKKDAEQGLGKRSKSAYGSLILAILALPAATVPILGFSIAVLAFWLGARSHRSTARATAILGMGFSLVAMVLATVIGLVLICIGLMAAR